MERTVSGQKKKEPRDLHGHIATYSRRRAPVLSIDWHSGATRYMELSMLCDGTLKVSKVAGSMGKRLWRKT